MPFRISILAAFIFLAFSAVAQTESAAFSVTGRGIATTTVTDYQAIGINPANIGLTGVTGQKWTLGFAEFGASLHSDALERSELRDVIFKFGSIQLDEIQQELFSQDFAESGLSLNFDIMGAGLSVRLDERNSLAFNVAAEATAYFKLNEFASSLFFTGFDFETYFDTIIVILGDTTGISTLPERISDLFDGTRLNFTTTAEINAAYSRLLVDKKDFRLYGGVGLKYVLGYAIFDFDVSDRDLKGFSSLSPGFIFNLDNLSTPSLITSDGLTPVGHGFGVDLGLNMQADKWTFGLALTDIGGIRWTGNVVEFNDAFLDSLQSSGIGSFNIIDELDTFIEEQLLVSDGVDSRNSSLPLKARVGASMSPVEGLDVGIDFVVPLNRAAGNLARPQLGIGGEYCFGGFYNVSSGLVVGGNFDFEVPMGVTLKLPRYEMGIATRDVRTIFGSEKPTISLAFGFLRWKFGTV